MGEADNKNFKALCELVSAESIISPQLDYKHNTPRAILNVLTAQVDTDDFIFVGQSLGGWYADQLSRKFQRPCILTNPCYYPHELELIAESGIPAEFLEQYREISALNRNEYATVLCSDADTVLPNNYEICLILSHIVTKVHGSHSTIQNLTAEFQNILQKL